MDVEAAMAPDAPVLHDDIFTSGVDPKPTKPSNISKMVRFTKGDVEAGFREAEVVIERRYTTKPVHQGYIEPHACVVSVAPDGQTTIWSSSQGQFMVRGYTARIVGADIANIRAIPAEIGGGFGGKTIVYLEPVAYMLSKKSGRAVKIVMSREEVFRATGPTSGAVVEVKLGAKKDGRIVAAQAVLKYQSGAFQGSPVQQGCICGFAPYDLPNVEFDRLRRALQSSQSRRLSRPRRTDLGVRNRKLPRRAGPRAEHRPVGAAPEKRRQGWHQSGARTDLDEHRLRQNPRGSESASAVANAARPEPGSRHRLRLLAQCRR